MWTQPPADNPLTALAPEQLRQRTSVKWRKYPPDVLPLFVAEMDTPLAEPVQAALVRAIQAGDVGYAYPGRLAEAYAGFAGRRFGWTPDPARIVLLPDVMQGVRAILETVTAPGDGVLVNPPVYPPFYTFVAAAGRRVVDSPLGRTTAGRYHLDLDRLAADLARPDVAAYLLCNPHNPTGLVLRPDELAAAADLAHRHGVRLLVDEIHAPLTYPGVTHTPIGALAGPGPEAAIVLVSASKAWNLPGLKAALAVANGPGGAATLAALPEELPFGAGLLGVLASEAAFDHGEPWLDALLAGLDHNRRYLGERLAARLPEVGYTPPDGTYLAWLDLRATGLGDDPAEALLDRGRVALYAGPLFGPGGAGHARLNLATSPSTLDDAVERIATTVLSGR